MVKKIKYNYSGMVKKNIYYSKIRNIYALPLVNLDIVLNLCVIRKLMKLLDM